MGRTLEQAELEVTLPPGDLAPRAARAELDRFTGPLLAEAKRSQVRLLVSELVTNGVMHGTGDVRLHAQARQDALRVEVIDEGQGIRPRIPDPSREGGWGLVIVDSLADRWGLFAGSTHVWFEVDRTASAN